MQRRREYQGEPGSGGCERRVKLGRGTESHRVKAQEGRLAYLRVKRRTPHVWCSSRELCVELQQGGLDCKGRRGRGGANLSIQKYSLR